jgi:hypothetical protein
MAKSVGMICFVAAALFSGCCLAQQTIIGPSGKPLKPSYRAKCKSTDDCYAQATRACGGRSYQILDSESHAGGLLADILPGPVTWYSMSYMCGPSDGRLADFPFTGPRYNPPSIRTCSQVGTTVTCVGN